MDTIILASTSPRRSEILTKLSIPFIAISPPFEEKAPNNMSIDEIPEYFAREKALSILPLREAHQKDLLILGSDTIVVCNNIVYGKPQNKEDAKNTIKALSGKRHKIISGLAVYNPTTGNMISKTSINYLSVRKLNESDIQWYLEKNEWQDAAGSYKVQGYFQRFVSNIEGSFSSIMGLPIFEFYDILSEHDYVVS